jgi:glutamate N-acetyltransferase/amino-acid N-acetyltransferase
VTFAKGFLAAAVASGIKAGGSNDLAIVLAEDGPVPAAGLFTANSAAAAPVILSRRRVADGRARAVLLNSGCANAGTGIAGMNDAELITEKASELLVSDSAHVLMCSTGPIGSRLPVERVIGSLPGLINGASSAGADAAAEAIMTTDSRAKTATAEGRGFVVGGMAKGAGMLRPDMATMLAVLTTDANVDAATLRDVLAEAVPPSFNSLNVDGCESTNDSVLILASGKGSQPSMSSLGSAVESVCRQLAMQMAADAEGASRVVTLHVTGATDTAAARRLGRVVADSGLVRASFYGGDPNWGRILAALGTCQVDPGSVSIAYEGITVAENGAGVPFDDQKLSKLLTGDFKIEIKLGDGSGRAQIITTDLTPDYVRFNGERS